MSDQETREILMLWAEVNSTEPINLKPHFNSLRLMLEGKRTKREYVQRILGGAEEQIRDEEIKVKKAETELDIAIRKLREVEADKGASDYAKKSAKEWPSGVEAKESGLKSAKEWLARYQKQAAELMAIIKRFDA